MPNTPLNIDLGGYKYQDLRDPIWGDSYNWSFTRRLDQVIKLAIHHTVTNHNASPNDIALLHKNRGWGGIGYHFTVGYDGTVSYVGDIATGRANIGGNNEKIIGIVLIGDFTKELPSFQQMEATKRLCEWFMKKYPALKNIDGWEDVMGHKDAANILKWVGAEPTQCPASNWNGDGGLLDRLKRGQFGGYPNDPQTPAPTPEPQPTPVPAPISDPTAKIDIGSEYGVIELRQVREFLTNLKKEKEQAQKERDEARIATQGAMDRLKAINEISK